MSFSFFSTSYIISFLYVLYIFYIFISFKGRFDLFKYKVFCEDCNELFDPFELEYVLKSEYWPGSPVAINYLIKEEVFVMWDAFRKRMPGSSQNAFLMALCDISKDNGRVSCSNVYIF